MVRWYCIEGLKTYDIEKIGSSFADEIVFVTPAKTMEKDQIFAFPGFDPYPATGKSVTIPEHFFYYRVGPNGLTLIRPNPVPGGAPHGIFEQIGVELPPL